MYLEKPKKEVDNRDRNRNKINDTFNLAGPEGGGDSEALGKS